MKKDSGFSLVELLLILVLMGVLASYALVRVPDQKGLVLKAQTELLLHHLRHTQALAMQWGKRLRFSVSANGYSVSCVSSGSAPCDQSPVIDPATGQGFSIQLNTGISLSTAGTYLDFDSLGRPLAAGAIASADSQWQISASGFSRTITVTAISGRVSSS